MILKTVLITALSCVEFLVSYRASLQVAGKEMAAIDTMIIGKKESRADQNKDIFFLQFVFNRTPMQVVDAYYRYGSY